MEVWDAKRLRELEAESAKLKKIVADQALHVTAMKELAGKELIAPPGPSAKPWAS